MWVCFSRGQWTEIVVCLVMKEDEKLRKAIMTTVCCLLRKNKMVSSCYKGKWPLMTFDWWVYRVYREHSVCSEDMNIAGWITDCFSVIKNLLVPVNYGRVASRGVGRYRPHNWYTVFLVLVTLYRMDIWIQRHFLLQLHHPLISTANIVRHGRKLSKKWWRRVLSCTHSLIVVDKHSSGM